MYIVAVSSFASKLREPKYPLSILENESDERPPIKVANTSEILCKDRDLKSHRFRLPADFTGGDVYFKLFSVHVFLPEAKSITNCVPKIINRVSDVIFKIIHRISNIVSEVIHRVSNIIH